MGLFDTIKKIFNSGKYTAQVPGMTPGNYYLTDAGDVAVKKAVASSQPSGSGLPIVYYTESNYPGAANYGGYQFIVPSDVKKQMSTSGLYPEGTGNIGLGGQWDPSTGKNEDSLYTWQRNMAVKAGTVNQDPLGFNTVAKKQVVQYQKLPETGLPVWYPQPSSPIGMSGSSIIFGQDASGKTVPKKVITGTGPFDIVGA